MLTVILAVHACFKVRLSSGGRAPNPAMQGQQKMAPTWLLGMLHSQLNIHEGLMDPLEDGHAMHNLSFLCNQPGRRQQR